MDCKRNFKGPFMQRAMPDSKQYPRNLHLINNVKDIVVFLGLTCFHSNNSYILSNSRNTQVNYLERNHK